MTVDSTGTSSKLGASISDYFALLKPRVMSLVVFTGFAGLLVAPGNLEPLLALISILCIAISAGAAGAINMWYERDIDSLMERTCNRPIPAGRIAPNRALLFGVILNILPVLAMGILLNWVAASLLAFAAGFYIFVYTIWLKRRTPQNIVIGGAAGAIPPMIGWASVTGSVNLESLVLFLIIFMWTPPHFWALALYRDGDYAKAGIPMLPVVSGAKETRRQILIYTLLLVPLTFLPVAFETAGIFYGVVTAILGAYFMWLAIQIVRKGDERSAKRLFGFSILYLFALFAALIIDQIKL
ncbi:MAG: protoheme IX farnesyltransferase [Alphaproteobacteria bacterium]|nr:protoheme IX farnesyltransferase [Alphaproteobacteria bacterium]PPR14649.1 MAG: Protoheme IX farnesyltransferase [Alphaproteobacteria bacterium MarineAlpha12_Bin1]